MAWIIKNTLMTVYVFLLFFELNIFAGSSPAQIDWPDLRGFNPKTEKPTPKLEKIDGKYVKIYGFMVPLEDFQSQISEFLLVPSPLACIHVPAPPPNQIVFVTLKKKMQPSMLPIVVEGKFKIMNTDSPYGKTSFWIKADKVTDFSPSP